jgi:electron transfer flavoprotein beta subunit
MNIIVCVKQIPDPETPASSFRIDEINKAVVPAQGIAPVVNPYDPQATEAALRLRDAAGEGTITVISLGPASARDSIKHALAMGADEGILIQDNSFDNGDHYTTAVALAKAIEKAGDYDLILTGRQSADWDAGIVPSGIAEILGIPSVTVAKSIEPSGNGYQVVRVLDNGFETVEVQAPCLISISNEFGDPRYPQLKQIMAAAKKTVQVWGIDDLDLSAADVGVEGSRLVLEKLYAPKNEVNVEIIEGDSPEEKAQNLARRLRETRIL